MISVIIPNYNHALFLKHRIESVLQQTYQHLEIILLDDCSVDNSKEIIENYANHPKVSHIVYNETNSGSSFKQWQRGIALAKGDLIWIAESDDTSTPDFLEKMITVLQQDNNIGIAYCRTMQIDKAGNECGLHYWPDALDDKRWTKPYFNTGINELRDYFLYRNIIVNASSAVFKKEHALPAIEYVVQNNMRFCGDWLFYSRILQHTNIIYLSEALNFQRYHALTTRYTKNHDEELQRIAECMFSAEEIGKFLKLKPRFSDKRYDWIFQYAFEKMPLSFKTSKEFIGKINNKKVIIKMLADHVVRWHINPRRNKISSFRHFLTYIRKAI